MSLKLCNLADHIFQFFSNSKKHDRCIHFRREGKATVAVLDCKVNVYRFKMGCRSDLEYNPTYTILILVLPAFSIVNVIKMLKKICMTLFSMLYHLAVYLHVLEKRGVFVWFQSRSLYRIVRLCFHSQNVHANLCVHIFPDSEVWSMVVFCSTIIFFYLLYIHSCLCPRNQCS